MTHSDDDSTPKRLVEIGSPYCLNCGYALVGLEPTGTCPECGQPYGNEMTLVGFQSPRSSTTKLIVTTIILLGVGFVNWFYLGFFTCCSMPFLGMGAYMLWKTYRTYTSLTVIGGDLRWIVNNGGVRTIRYQKSEIQLLSWDQIRDVRIKNSISFRDRGWRALHTRRSFLSLDLARMRAQEIWFADVSLDEMKELRQNVLQLKNPPN